MTIGPAPDREFDLTAIPRAITEAGFQPAQMRLRARGAFDLGAEDCFRIRGWSRCYPVRGQHASESTAEHTIHADVDFTGETGGILVLRDAAR